MADGRKNNGGHKNSGRKSKGEEQNIIEKLKPLEDIAFAALKKAMEDSKQHKWVLPLYYGYLWGKPLQSIKADVNTSPIIVFENLANERKTDNDLLEDKETDKKV